MSKTIDLRGAERFFRAIAKDKHITFKYLYTITTDKKTVREAVPDGHKMNTLAAWAYVLRYVNIKGMKFHVDYTDSEQMRSIFADQL